MLKLNEFSHNHHLSRVKMLAKYFRRGISIVDELICYLQKENSEELYNHPKFVRFDF
jgi:hypothetical protein